MDCADRPTEARLGVDEPRGLSLSSPVGMERREQTTPPRTEHASNLGKSRVEFRDVLDHQAEDSQRERLVGKR